MRKGVALAEAALRSDVFVAAGKGNRLEADEGDLLGVFHREISRPEPTWSLFTVC